MSDVTMNPPTDAQYAEVPLSRREAAVIRPRLWPALVILAVQWTAKLLAEQFWRTGEGWFYTAFVGPMLGSLLVLLWWLFASRVPWLDRFLMLLVVLAGGAAVVLTDPIAYDVGANKVLMFALPVTLAAGALWLLVTPPLRWPWRRLGLIVALLLPSGYYALLRLDGVEWGELQAKLNWRWDATTEDDSMKEIRQRPAPKPLTSPEKPLELQAGDWPGFRGADRDGKLHGVRLETQWDKYKPQLVWKQRIGPGWSSFAVIGNRLYTQEQRDNDEAVVCYDADTGKELWKHLDTNVRFIEAVGGNGPRATPTFHAGRLYTLGAKGNLNCLDAATGKSRWPRSRSLTDDTGAKVPVWAFASSPLVIQGVVVVIAGGPENKAVQAYDIVDGKPNWAAGKGTHSYSSPQRAIIDGVEQVVIVTEQGLSGLDPKGGKVLWNYEWDEGVQRVVQPTQIGESDFLIGTTFNKGMRRLHVSHGKDGWKVEEVWKTNKISPYFNDMVIYDKHLYGFDGGFLVCVSLDKGERRWKERGYGAGQVLLLADQGVLLVLTEKGEVALVAADPSDLKELARIPAVDGKTVLDGKTWNHPVIAHGRLYLRNDHWMACYRLKTDSAPKLSN
jgi:outer membrane protein assembly factor BamB